MEEQIAEMIRKITRFSLVIVPAVSAAAFFVWGWLTGLNILIGGVISLLSFRAIVWAVRKFLAMQMAQAAIMGLSIIKLILISIILIVLAVFGLILPVPLICGFTIVLALIVMQGLVTASRFKAE